MVHVLDDEENIGEHESKIRQHIFALLLNTCTCTLKLKGQYQPQELNPLSPLTLSIHTG